MDLIFEPVSATNVEVYIKVGIQSYQEHYLHLWENQNPHPFIEAHLTKVSVLSGMKDLNQLFFLIKSNEDYVGILNLTLDAEKGTFLDQENLLVNKLYLLKKYTGRGLGAITLKFVDELAKNQKKRVVWLYTMKKGRTRRFYEMYGYRIIKGAIIELPFVLDAEKEMWLMAKPL